MKDNIGSIEKDKPRENKQNNQNLLPEKSGFNPANQHRRGSAQKHVHESELHHHSHHGHDHHQILNHELAEFLRNAKVSGFIRNPATRVYLGMSASESEGEKNKNSLKEKDSQKEESKMRLHPNSLENSAQMNSRSNVVSQYLPRNGDLIS